MEKQKPSHDQVLALQKLYPRLDYLMCETILSFTEEELELFLQNKPQNFLSDAHKQK